ncbi:MAG: hypothetical protein A3F84_18175 [Candidatus Handelsmanbacteria bacterium RIFCSPLOWO2_12_FULL_64_10]|uniref:Uncharacterized protein n=1 Tax=Handelsmanbacteria sp. (strain RIFCSPLOWO2_12_FULL_64_10) TaxID=1817868 RepID=A0A1F6CCN6_HANXR|nr:MAG: hypothetical protein A3F84_18175 [Candidatus Handelsmanbacteria bacterium RIFCSPLOWO2_12_FULL_64_10]
MRAGSRKNTKKREKTRNRNAKDAKETKGAEPLRLSWVDVGRFRVFRVGRRWSGRVFAFFAIMTWVEGHASDERGVPRFHFNKKG